MDAIYFDSPAHFRKWLKDHHSDTAELLVGFYKVGSGKCTMTWSQAVDEALCYGWIDGVKKSVDKDRYTHRFTPRRKGSTWSNVNIDKAKNLIADGKMTKAGLQAFEARTEANSGIYAHEIPDMTLSSEYEKLFRSNKSAWEFFNKQPPSYRKVVIKQIMTAKQPATQLSRLQKAIDASASAKRL